MSKVKIKLDDDYSILARYADLITLVHMAEGKASLMVVGPSSLW